MVLRGTEHPKAKLTPQAVADIYWRYEQGGNTYLSLADEYGVDGGTISNILRGKTWKSVTGGRRAVKPPVGLATHCAAGHEMTPENTHWRPKRDDRPNPHRECRACKRKSLNTGRRRRRSGNYR